MTKHLHEFIACRFSFVDLLLAVPVEYNYESQCYFQYVDVSLKISNQHVLALDNEDWRQKLAY